MRPLQAYVSISIADTGAGMSDAVKERAFEPFFTTKEAGRGTGLGLSTVYGFVKQSKGAIALDSSPGAGTVVTLYIPAVADGEQGRAAEKRADDDTGALSGLRVLVVEDEPEVREVVRHFLLSLGCSVALCANADQGLLELAQDKGFDLLLSDVALGAGMRGTELARQAKERAPGLAILLMSGYSAELLSLRAIRRWPGSCCASPARASSSRGPSRARCMPCAGSKADRIATAA